jgi:hypothetical protein
VQEWAFRGGGVGREEGTLWCGCAAWFRRVVCVV